MLVDSHGRPGIALVKRAERHAGARAPPRPRSRSRAPKLQAQRPACGAASAVSSGEGLSVRGEDEAPAAVSRTPRRRRSSSSPPSSTSSVRICCDSVGAGETKSRAAAYQNDPSSATVTTCGAAGGVHGITIDNDYDNSKRWICFYMSRPAYRGCQIKRNHKEAPDEPHQDNNDESHRTLQPLVPAPLGRRCSDGSLVLVASVLGGVGATHTSAADVRNFGSARAGRCSTRVVLSPRCRGRSVQAPKGAAVRSPEGRAGSPRPSIPVRAGASRTSTPPHRGCARSALTSLGARPVPRSRAGGDGKDGSAGHRRCRPVASRASAYTIDEFGSASANNRSTTPSGRDFKRAETRSIAKPSVLLSRSARWWRRSSRSSWRCGDLHRRREHLAIHRASAPDHRVRRIDVLLIGLAVGVDYSPSTRGARVRRRAEAPPSRRRTAAAATPGGCLDLRARRYRCHGRDVPHREGRSSASAEATVLVVAVAISARWPCCRPCCRCSGTASTARIPWLGVGSSAVEAEAQTSLDGGHPPGAAPSALVCAAPSPCCLVLAVPARGSNRGARRQGYPARPADPGDRARIQRAFPGRASRRRS